MTQPRKLYRHKETKHVIEVANSLTPDGELAYCSQGGGFLRSMPAAKLDTDYEPYVIPAFDLGHVTFDMAPDDTAIPAYLNGQRWNGWAMPFFPAESMAKVIEIFPFVTYDAGRDAYLVKENDNPDEEDWLVTAEIITTADGQTVKTYPVGAGSWTWEKTDAPSDNLATP